MKITLAVVLTLLCYCSISQSINSNTEWVMGTISLKNEDLVAEISLNNKFFEGTLLIKNEDKIISLSPQVVNSFFVKNPDSQKDVVFRSIETTFLNRNGSKKSFLKETFQGDNFSLYSKFIPDKNTAPFLFPVGGGWIAYGVFSYLADTEVIFLESGGHAYQISIPKHGSYEDYFTLNKSLFFDIMGERKEAVKKYMKENRKKLRYRPDIIDIIKYANTI